MRPTRGSGSGRDVLTKVQEGFGGFPGCEGGVRRHSQRSDRGWDAHSEVRVGSGGPSGGLRVFGTSSQRSRRPSQRFGRGRESPQRSVWGRKALQKG